MKGQQLEIVVDSLSNSGDGVGRWDGKVLFIPFACPGDKLLVQIVENKKSFARARILEVLEPSDQRVQPPCPVFGQCGGCQWQHINYPIQLQWKKRNLLDVLKRIGKLDLEDKVTDTQPSANTYHYRNRIQIHLDSSGPFFFKKGDKRKVHTESCLLASQAINGFLEEGQLQSHFRAGKWELADDPEGVQVHFVDDKGQSDLGFRQVNSEQNQFLIDQIGLAIAQTPTSLVYDLYCGKGNWSLALARDHKSVSFRGVDSNPINIKEAQKNASENCEFLLGDASLHYPFDSRTPDLVIIDPPRAGCSPELLDKLSGEQSPQFLVYISCHPATLARDLGLLTERDWTIEKVIPVDMFPQTSHLESFCLLRSTKG